MPLLLGVAISFAGCATLLGIEADPEPGQQSSDGSAPGPDSPDAGTGSSGATSTSSSSSGSSGQTSSSGGAGSSSGGCPEGLSASDGGCDDLRVWTYASAERAANAGSDDRFGNAVALSADGATMAVAAYWESSSEKGVNGNGTNNDLLASGAVYVFRKAGGAWGQQAYLKTSDSAAGAYFGWSLAISADGNTVVAAAKNPNFNAVGSPDRARAYVFVRSANVWSEQAILRSEDASESDQFGQGVSVSGDGQTIAVGAMGHGAGGGVYVFTRSAELWSRAGAVLTEPTGNNFGSSVVLSHDGRTLFVGDPGDDSASVGVGATPGNGALSFSGAVSMFTADASRANWSRALFFKASNPRADAWFGRSLAVSADARVFVVGADRERSAFSGVSEGGAPDGGVPLEEAGAAYIFRNSGNDWHETFVKAVNTRAAARFGATVAISHDGRTVTVGAPGETSSAAGVDGDPSDDSASGRGAAYAYSRNSTGDWTARAYLKPAALGSGFAFGSSVALSGDGSEAAVGAVERQRVSQPFGTVSIFRAALP